MARASGSIGTSREQTSRDASSGTHLGKWKSEASVSVTVWVGKMRCQQCLSPSVRCGERSRFRQRGTASMSLLLRRRRLPRTILPKSVESSVIPLPVLPICIPQSRSRRVGHGGDPFCRAEFLRKILSRLESKSLAMSLPNRVDEMALIRWQVNPIRYEWRQTLTRARVSRLGPRANGRGRYRPLVAKLEVSTYDVSKLNDQLHGAHAIVNLSIAGLKRPTNRTRE